MNDYIKSCIGKELSKLRIDNDYSIEELSFKTKLNKDTLYRYERGKGNSFDTLSKILEVYNYNFKIFFDKIYDRMQKKEK